MAALPRRFAAKLRSDADDKVKRRDIDRRVKELEKADPVLFTIFDLRFTQLPSTGA